MRSIEEKGEFILLVGGHQIGESKGSYLEAIEQLQGIPEQTQGVLKKIQILEVAGSFEKYKSGNKFGRIGSLPVPDEQVKGVIELYENYKPFKKFLDGEKIKSMSNRKIIKKMLKIHDKRVEKTIEPLFNEILERAKEAAKSESKPEEKEVENELLPIETGGLIVELLEDFDDFKKGDRVEVMPNIYKTKVSTQTFYYVAAGILVPTELARVIDCTG